MDKKETLYREKLASLDELFLHSRLYNTSGSFLNLLEFINKFPLHSPFNAFLIHMQNSGVEIALTAKKWKEYGREIIFGSRPMVILVPFGPVEFVYDVADTTGTPLPKELINPFYTQGKITNKIFERVIRNCSKEIIYKDERNFTKGLGGYASLEKNDTFKITLNSNLDLPSKFSTFIHELAHIYCGHLGTISSSWWDRRTNLSIDEMEIEAESVSYLVCTRMGLDTTSAGYMAPFIRSNDILKKISLDIILTVSNHIESLCKTGFKLKQPKKLK